MFVRDSLNNAYYGQMARPVDIVVRQAVSNESSASLRAVQGKAAK